MKVDIGLLTIHAALLLCIGIKESPEYTIYMHLYIYIQISKPS